MCDYSLSVASRPAIEGERLVLNRFSNGVHGFVGSPAVTAERARPTGLHAKIRELLFPESACAVCLPHGAKLAVRDLPACFGVAAPAGDGEATFVQGTHMYSRDAIRFRDGSEVLLQWLPAGQIVDVLSLAPAVSGASGIELESMQFEAVRD